MAKSTMTNSRSCRFVRVRSKQESSKRFQLVFSRRQRQVLILSVDKGIPLWPLKFNLCPAVENDLYSSREQVSCAAVVVCAAARGHTRKLARPFRSAIATRLFFARLRYAVQGATNRARCRDTRSVCISGKTM